ncbi:MAG: sigma-70 family RNA polymerase sigma factor [Clostridiales bacterium]|nr:sigma-70 family RNA polymerase sigma factor [Clostridiales bacterium]
MKEQEFVERLEVLKARLYRTALLYLGGEAAALDAVDEAVYRGLVSCGRLRQEEFFTTWITRILINVCNDELRRRRREIAVEELPETAAEAFDALPLRDAVARLPRELRAVVVLRYFSGYTLEETARALKTPVGTVSTRQRKALALLRLELADGEEV